MKKKRPEADLLGHILDPILIINGDYQITYANDAASVLFPDSVGQRLQEILPDGDGIFAALAANIDLPPVEWQNGDGLIFSVRVSALDTSSSANGNGDGAADDETGFLLLFRDVTRYRKQLQEMSTFVGTLAHDLRTPLTYMSGFASMIPMVGDLNDKQKGFQEKITTGINQLADLVEKVLDVRKLDDEGNYQLHREPADVVKLVSDVISTHSNAAEKKTLTLQAEIDPDLPILNLDEMMLKRAINNLVDNAVKYTPNSGKITLIAEIHDNHLILAVRDTGLGISAENKKKLFGQFQRIRRKEHMQIKGSGLGLYIVKAVAVRHGGDAWVESKEGAGSTFYISIPLSGSNLINAAEGHDEVHGTANVHHEQSEPTQEVEPQTDNLT
ncbi:MAG: PAS domain-containing sensor histidine kinase [Anaerolineae bacterium]|nr:PAS domain-containing sensor histidine kinase [Anaerolineae bacterium]